MCVCQTVHDLLDRGIEVHVPADAVGSRHEIDYERGLERMERAGAVVSTRRGGAVRAARARGHARVQGRAEADPVMGERDWIRAAGGRHALRRRGVRRRGARGRGGGVHDRHVRLPGVDDRPVVRGAADRVHLPAHRQLRRERAGDGVGEGVGARGDHARGVQPRGCPYGRARLAGLARRTAACPRSAAWTRARWCATSARRARCAAACFPRRSPRRGHAS